jgi:hypothetical protein
MTYASARISAIALGAAGLALFAPLCSPSLAVAKTEVRHGPAAGAIHRTAGRATHAFHSGAVSRGQRFVSRSAHVSARRYAHGYGRHWRGYGYGGGIAGGGYAYPYYSGAYSEGYGASHYHSCRWYYYHEPYNAPYRCRGYGPSYGYSYGNSAPSYGYAYGPSYGLRAGGHWHSGYRHYAIHQGWHGSTHLARAGAHHGVTHFAAHAAPRVAGHGGPHLGAHGGHGHMVP